MTLARPRSPVVDQVYQHRQSGVRSWRALCALFRDLCAISLLSVEVYYGFVLEMFGLKQTPLTYVTSSLLIIFIFSAVVDLIRYLHCTFATGVPEMNDVQRRLLAVQENEVWTRTTPSGYVRNSNTGSPVFSMLSKPGIPNYVPQLMGSSMDKGHTSLSPGHASLSSSQASLSPSHASISPGYASLSPGSYGTPSNLSSSPYFASRRSYEHLDPHYSSPSLPDALSLDPLSIRDNSPRTRFRKSSGHKDIMNMRGLNILLREESRAEQQHTIRLNEELLYSYYQGYQMEMPHFPYQVACRSPQSISALSDDDSNDTFHGEEIWYRLGIGQPVLDVWIERIRRFLSQTIVSRVSGEIRKLNKQLRRLGLHEMEIGEVSISTLKQIAHTKSYQLETLNSVIPFLDMTPNQQYLVARIHELGKGGCMSDFNWNGGMEYRSKPWSEHLPTDSAIVVHCLCTYLDSRLPPHPKFPDGRTFTSQHFLKVPEKPKPGKSSLIIYQSKTNPPHFKVIAGSDIWDVTKGRNNMFQAILLFLYFIKTKDGMLDRVSLGVSGINILWVLEDGENTFLKRLSGDGNLLSI